MRYHKQQQHHNQADAGQLLLMKVQKQELDGVRQVHDALVAQTEAVQLEAWRRALQNAGITTAQRTATVSTVTHVKGMYRITAVSF